MMEFIKETYESPEIEIIEFCASDIICTSIYTGNEDEGEWNPIW